MSNYVDYLYGISGEGEPVWCEYICIDSDKFTYTLGCHHDVPTIPFCNCNFADFCNEVECSEEGLAKLGGGGSKLTIATGYWIGLGFPLLLVTKAHWISFNKHYYVELVCVINVFRFIWQANRKFRTLKYSFEKRALYTGVIRSVNLCKIMTQPSLNKCLAALVVLVFPSGTVIRITEI